MRMLCTKSLQRGGSGGGTSVSSSSRCTYRITARFPIDKIIIAMTVSAPSQTYSPLPYAVPLPPSKTTPTP